SSGRPAWFSTTTADSDVRTTIGVAPSVPVPTAFDTAGLVQDTATNAPNSIMMIFVTRDSRRHVAATPPALPRCRNRWRTAALRPAATPLRRPDNLRPGPG